MPLLRKSNNEDFKPVQLKEERKDVAVPPTAINQHIGGTYETFFDIQKASNGADDNCSLKDLFS